MGDIFRTATGQAIREIIEEHAVAGRFGIILTPESLDQVAERIVELFVMTLELRAKTAEMRFSKTESSSTPLSTSSQGEGHLVTSPREREKTSSSFRPPQIYPALPRQRYEMTDKERQRFSGR